MLQSLQRIFVAALLLVALPAMAQSDPPARVGRLAHLENEVNFRVDRNDQGGPATLNWPISNGAILETGRSGRAEIWIGSTAYRLGEESQVEFPAIDDARVDVRLNDGRLAISILDRDQADDVVVATPDGEVRFLTPGRYRIDVFADHSTLTVQAGRATFDGGQRVMPVAAGQKASRWSDGRERLDGDWDQDAFDQWVARRENATLPGAARRYVSPHMTGYQDLDAYGDWQSAPDYGAVWYPRAVADDWAPYRYGRWAWVAPWGWTWIDLAPWGFAPFHYGRWVIIRGRWAWVPGRLVPRPVYAPALVAWIGNPGWSVGFSFGSAPAVGWFPLAPREVYVPWHHHSQGYVRQINMAQVRDVAVIDRAIRSGRQAPFVYHDKPQAVTVVPANVVREGRSISSRDVRRPQRSELARAPLAPQAPTAGWLAPAPGAVRPHDEPRRSAGGRQPHRDVEAARPDIPERRSPLGETMPRSGERPPRQALPEGSNGRDSDARRDGLRRPSESRPESESRGRSGDARSDANARPFEPAGRQPEAPPPPQRRGERQPPAGESPARESPREMAPPLRRQALPPEVRQVMPESAPARPAERRLDVFGRPPEVPARQSEALPQVPRREERPRPALPVPEREPRHEPARDLPRMERQAPPREAPQSLRQPEPARPAPEVRAPAPQPQREMHPPRMEAPRSPAPQGGGPNEQRRRQDDERGPR